MSGATGRPTTHASPTRNRAPGAQLTLEQAGPVALMTPQAREMHTDSARSMPPLPCVRPCVQLRPNSKPPPHARGCGPRRLAQHPERAAGLHSQPAPQSPPTERAARITQQLDATGLAGADRTYDPRMHPTTPSQAPTRGPIRPAAAQHKALHRPSTPQAAAAHIPCSHAHHARTPPQHAHYTLHTALKSIPLLACRLAVIPPLAHSRL